MSKPLSQLNEEFIMARIKADTTYAQKSATFGKDESWNKGIVNFTCRDARSELTGAYLALKQEISGIKDNRQRETEKRLALSILKGTLEQNASAATNSTYTAIANQIERIYQQEL